ncbi:MAG TPA: hypothetical protein VFW87_01950 [Pirellulales bacterium]|nr:hypothetical protein [Pirellulales bacterium]
MVFGAKWALFFFGPIVALSWIGVIGLTTYNYLSGALGPEQLPTVVMALISILFLTLALLLAAVVGSALAGALIMGLAGFASYRRVRDGSRASH